MTTPEGIEALAKALHDVDGEPSDFSWHPAQYVTALAAEGWTLFRNTDLDGLTEAAIEVVTTATDFNTYELGRLASPIDRLEAALASLPAPTPAASETQEASRG